jgi:hypothetical protein
MGNNTSSNGENQTCKSCSGSGKLDCGNCNGAGNLEASFGLIKCEKCNYGKRKCDSCNGKGSIRS